EARRPDLDHFRRHRERPSSGRQTMTAACHIPGSINGSSRFLLPLTHFLDLRNHSLHLIAVR
ncbi:MAG: hypothetical protein WBC80_07365, partial [Isosphaeraceae bacterium]